MKLMKLMFTANNTDLWLDWRDSDEPTSCLGYTMANSCLQRILLLEDPTTVHIDTATSFVSSNPLTRPLLEDYLLWIHYEGPLLLKHLAMAKPSFTYCYTLLTTPSTISNSTLDAAVTLLSKTLQLEEAVVVDATGHSNVEVAAAMIRHRVSLQYHTGEDLSHALSEMVVSNEAAFNTLVSDFGLGGELAALWLGVLQYVKGLSHPIMAECVTQELIRRPKRFPKRWIKALEDCVQGYQNRESGRDSSSSLLHNHLYRADRWEALWVAMADELERDKANEGTKLEHLVSLLNSIRRTAPPDLPPVPAMQRVVFRHLNLFNMIRAQGEYDKFGNIALVQWIVQTCWGGPHPYFLRLLESSDRLSMGLVEMVVVAFSLMDGKKEEEMSYAGATVDGLERLLLMPAAGASGTNFIDMVTKLLGKWATKVTPSRGNRKEKWRCKEKLMRIVMALGTMARTSHTFVDTLSSSKTGSSLLYYLNHAYTNSEAADRELVKTVLSHINQ